MSEERERNARELLVRPAVTALKVVGLFLDVATLMLRLLFNTIVHNTPQGRQGLGEERELSPRES